MFSDTRYKPVANPLECPWEELKEVKDYFAIPYGEFEKGQLILILKESIGKVREENVKDFEMTVLHSGIVITRIV